MEYKYKSGQKVRILDVESLSDRCAWSGKEVTLATQDTWDEPAWSVKEPDCCYRFRESEMALAGPVRTETITRTVIEPGVYGRLYVEESKYTFDTQKQVGVSFVRRDTPHREDLHAGFLMTATELRELARIATELAEGLDAQ
jgi:hypothetical protein